MTNPIDIVAAALAGRNPEAFALAQAAANALTDERIVANAGEALRDDDGSLSVPDGVRHLSADARRHVALVVLRSVGEA